MNLHRDKYKLTFVINSLSREGAQGMLVRLLGDLDREIFDPTVISLLPIDGGPASLATAIRTLEIPLASLEMRSVGSAPAGLLALIRQMRTRDEGIVQSWMYHADLVSALANLAISRQPLVWNIRHSNLDPAVDRWTTRATVKVCAVLSSRLPRKIVCCSEVARRVHIELGYDPEKFVVIPNGFDLHHFKPDPEARKAVRDELGLNDQTLLIGMAGRFHPQKDHGNFLHAAALLTRQCPQSAFLLCGTGIDPANHRLTDMIDDRGLRGRVHLLGQRPDMARVFAALDLATLSSACGEGFPNVIGEAMACGVPCVVTEVGDAALLVGEAGMVVPPRDAEALRAAWQQLLGLPAVQRLALGVQARARIQAHFSLRQVTNRYQDLYLALSEQSVGLPANIAP